MSYTLVAVGRNIRFVVLATLWLSFVSLSARADNWLTSYEEAVSKSKQTGKPILMDFTGSDWCGWCMKLKAEVFDTKEFKEWASKNVVLLEVDFPRSKKQSPALKAQNRKLLDKYGVRGFPTIVFVDSSGKELGRYGYDRGGPSVWIKKAEKFLK